VKEDGAVVDGEGKEIVVGGKDGEEWQNLEDYQLEQEDIEEEIGVRSNVVAHVGDELQGGSLVVDEEEGDEFESELAEVKKTSKRKLEGGEQDGMGAKKPKDKDARRAEKKAKLKQERREKAEAAQEAARKAAQEESD
jgi:hypothetical protein